MSIALQAIVPNDLAKLAAIDITDARKIVSLVHRHGVLPPKSPATIRRVALDAAKAIGFIPTLDVLSRLGSSVDPFVKFTFRLSDEQVIETVRIPLEKAGRFSVCVSSQVGCALACSFCATGTLGLKRNLEVWEMVEQVRRVRHDFEAFSMVLPEGVRPKIHGVVFQGMGEPMANLERVIEAIRVLGEPSAQAIDVRNITVCTAGIPSGIRRLAKEVPAARLGLSLGSARKEVRRSLMPIEGAHSLESVLLAVGEHAQATGHSPMFAYTLLSDQNDTPEDAGALAGLVTNFIERYKVRPRLSLIPFNDFEGTPFQRSLRLNEFRDVLMARGVPTIVRYSGGGDVGAACGQLVACGQREALRNKPAQTSAKPSS